MNRTDYRYLVLQIVLGVAITAYYYYPSLNNWFIWDDFWMLMYSGSDAKTLFFECTNLRMFGKILGWIAYSCFGFNHVAYNEYSIAVHCLNLTLVFLLLRKISGDAKFACVASTIFAAMSVYCDALLWKATVGTLTNLTFYCIILLFYLKGKESSRYYYLSLALFFLGILNKEEIASLPLMILFLERLMPDSSGELRQTLRRVAPYGAMVVAYIAASLIVSKLKIFPQEQFERLSRFDPLRSLFTGYSSFFLTPGGGLTSGEIVAYSLILPAVFTLALYFSKNRKMLLCGIGWVFFAYLPLSYSCSTGFNPTMLMTCISRHLYLPSIGVAIVMAAILLYSYRSLNHYTTGVVVSGVVMILIFYNAPRVHQRSAAWGWNRDSLGMRVLMRELKAAAPSFARGAYLIVDPPETGRSYMLRALRAFYQNDDVQYLSDYDRMFANDGSKVDIRTIPALYYITNKTETGEGVVVERIK